MHSLSLTGLVLRKIFCSCLSEAKVITSTIILLRYRLISSENHLSFPAVFGMMSASVGGDSFFGNLASRHLLLCILREELHLFQIATLPIHHNYKHETIAQQLQGVSGEQPSVIIWLEHMFCFPLHLFCQRIMLVFFTI